MKAGDRIVFEGPTMDPAYRGWAGRTGTVKVVDRYDATDLPVEFDDHPHQVVFVPHQYVGRLR